jgi:hypothetical protein
MRTYVTAMPVSAKESLFGAVFLLIMVASLASQDLQQNVDQVDAGSMANTNDEQLLHKNDEIAGPIDDRDVEALRPIDQFFRRHETDGDLETRVEAKSLGIAVITACITLFTNALTRAFENDSIDPKEVMSKIQSTFQVKAQKAKLNSYHGTLKELISKFERMEREPNSEQASGCSQAVMFHNTLRKDRCLFMQFENIHSSADFFIDFATIRTSVNEAIIKIYPEQTEYKEYLINNSKCHINYAKIVGQNFEYSAAIIQLLKPNIEYWMTLLPDTDRDVIREHGAIRSGDMVSFRRSDTSHWLGCAGKKNKCNWATCPTKDNPMATSNGQYTCWGERFQIQTIYHNGFIRSCDRVGICFSGKHWLSGKCNRGGVCQTVTRTCPGASATTMANGKCPWEIWKLHTNGKACDELIYDRDVIDFRGGSTGSYKPLNSRDTDTYYEHSGGYGYSKAIKRYETHTFTIFKSDVNYDDYKKFIDCRP